MDFGRYLLRELLWELQKFELTVPGLTDVPADSLEVLSYSGYEALTVRGGPDVFVARLDWSAQAAPQVIRGSQPAA